MSTITKYIVPKIAPTISKNVFDTLTKDGLKDEFVTQLTITADVAKHILDNYNKGNRPINQPNIDKYARDMINNRWAGHVGDEVCVDDKGLLYNGQHRLAAIVKSKKPQTISMRFGIDAAKRLTEGNGMKKSYSDRMTMQDVEGKYKVQRGAVVRMAYSFLNEPHTPSSFLKNIKPTDGEVDDEISVPYGEEIRNSVEFAITAGMKNICVETDAALVHWLISRSKHGKKAANEFILKLATGANLSSDDPVNVIRNRMVSVSYRDFFRSQKNKDASIGTMIKAFNASVAGKKWTSKERTAHEIPQINGLKMIGTYDVYKV